jgi:hypothetical protein
MAKTQPLYTKPHTDYSKSEVLPSDNGLYVDPVYAEACTGRFLKLRYGMGGLAFSTNFRFDHQVISKNGLPEGVDYAFLSRCRLKVSATASEIATIQD